MKSKPTAGMWTHDFILMLLISILATNAISIINAITSVYVVDALGATASQVGIVSSAMVLCAILFRPAAGFLIDRLGRKGVLIAATLLMALANAALLLPIGISAMVVIRLFTGIPFALSTTVMTTLISDVLEPQHRPAGLSYSTVVTMLIAMAVGPNMGLWVLERFGHRAVIYVATACGLSAAALALLVRAKNIRDASARLTLANMVERKALWIALVLGFSFSGMSGVVTFSPLFSSEMGYNSAGTFYLLYALGLILSRILNQWVTKKEYLPQAPQAAILSLAAGFAMIGLLRTRFFFLFGALLLGAGNGLLSPILFAMALNLVVPERRGACNATLMLGQDVSFVAGSYVFGWAAQSLGSYAAPYTSAAAVMVLPLLAYTFIVLPDYNRQLASRAARQPAAARKP